MANLGKRPVNAGARERLRQAQQREASALAAVESAASGKARAEAKLQAALRAPLGRIEAAQRRLAVTQADLVDVSGLSRAAALLDVPPATLRAAIRDATAKTEPGQQ